jgi:putative transcriptional regulator
MMQDADAAEDTSVLRSKRSATQYQILVEIADRQPAVNQQEIADAIDVTPQAVSDYLKGLIERGHVEKHGRGRYEITKEGVDWLISRTDSLRDLVEHVSTKVIGQVETETAIASTAIEEGQTVSLTMREGTLHAMVGDTGGAVAVAITDAESGRDVGITDVEGVVEYDLGAVTVISIPRVQNGGSDAVETVDITDLAATHDLIAAAGTEALVAARTAGIELDARFGTQHAVQEGAMRGLDVLLLATTDELSAHTDMLREGSISYEVVDTTTE